LPIEKKAPNLLKVSSTSMTISKIHRIIKYLSVGEKMMKLSLYPLMLSSLIFVGSPVLGSHNIDQFNRAARKAPPSIPVRSNQVAPQEAPRRAATNPFAPRMAQVQQEEKKVQETAKASYPQTFNADQIKLIVNTVLKSDGRGGQKRDAVFINHPKVGRMKVSVKNDLGLLNDLRQAIHGGMYIRTVNDDTQIIVPPSITAVYSQILQTQYNASTAQEETRKTGRSKKGCLVEYKLMRDGEPLIYLPKHAMAKQCAAKLILSITTE
jgi:hypothetical protein